MAEWTTEDEIEAEIVIIRTAIRNIALTGQKYEIGTGPSKRTFEAADINNLRDYLAQLKGELQEFNEESGCQLGF